MEEVAGGAAEENVTVDVEVTVYVIATHRD